MVAGANSFSAPGESDPGRGRDRLLAKPIPVTGVALTLVIVVLASYGSLIEGLIAAFTAAVLVVIAATDLERRVVPNQIVLPASAIVWLGHVVFVPSRALEFTLAALVAGGAFLLPAVLGKSLMGMGDVKLAVLMGVALGWGVVGAVTLACVAVFPFALGTVVRGGLAARKTALPFAPFLVLGALVELIVPHLGG
jgi:leader peptidase (prepilin peptidase)/N-methyltransferase